MIDAFLGFLGTLSGVLIAFTLNRWAREVREKETALQHLKAIETELEANSKQADNIREVIRTLQSNEYSDLTHHFALPLYTTDAWDTADSSMLVDELTVDQHQQLQAIYRESKNVNEWIRRLRTEMLHSAIGTPGEWGHEEWTTVMIYYDTENGEVIERGLGVLISDTSDDIQSTTTKSRKDLESEIQRLENETSYLTTYALQKVRF